MCGRNLDNEKKIKKPTCVVGNLFKFFIYFEEEVRRRNVNHFIVFNFALFKSNFFV